jgi:DNA-binding CsgD family transcriptional regulator
MKANDIKQLYKEIFKAYYKPSLEEHIKKIVELDAYLPYSSTFFCVTNTQNLTFEYISKNMAACLGLDPENMKRQGMKYFWSLIHPEDIEIWLKALNELMVFTLAEITVSERKRMSYTWNYRIKNARGKYVTIIQNTTPLEFDIQMKPIIGLAHYTVLHPDIHFPITATAKLLNSNDTYETKYFNNFSDKLLTDGISNRERDVIRLLALNYSSKDIAERLHISSHTVDTHRRNILKKLNITSTGELIGRLKSHELFL